MGLTTRGAAPARGLRPRFNAANLPTVPPAARRRDPGPRPLRRRQPAPDPRPARSGPSGRLPARPLPRPPVGPATRPHAGPLHRDASRARRAGAPGRRRHGRRQPRRARLRQGSPPRPRPLLARLHRLEVWPQMGRVLGPCPTPVGEPTPGAARARRPVLFRGRRLPSRPSAPHASPGDAPAPALAPDPLPGAPIRVRGRLLLRAPRGRPLRPPESQAARADSASSTRKRTCSSHRRRTAA